MELTEPKPVASIVSFQQGAKQVSVERLIVALCAQLDVIHTTTGERRRDALIEAGRLIAAESERAWFVAATPPQLRTMGHTIVIGELRKHLDFQSDLLLDAVNEYRRSLSQG